MAHVARTLAVALAILLPVASAQSTESIPLVIAADSAQKWETGSEEIWILRGNCYFNQGRAYARSQEAVVWIDRSEQATGRPTVVTTFLAGDISLDGSPGAPGNGTPAQPTANLPEALLVFTSREAPEVRASRIGGEPAVKPPIFRRAGERREAQLAQSTRRSQFAAVEAGPAPMVVPSAIQPPVADAPPPGVRRLRMFPRSSVPVSGKFFRSGRGDESIAVISSGINLIIDGLATVGTIDIATDRLVVWTTGIAGGELAAQTFQREDMPLEIYMEGNIVFRQGDRVVYADRMYYNVQRQVGVVLNAEILTQVPNYAGLARVRAASVQQIDAERFVARDAAVTTSRMGIPSYWFESDSVSFQDSQRLMVNPITGQPEMDPLTGQPMVDHQQLVSGRGNTVYLETLPIFYWPTIETDLKRPTFYLTEAKFKHDRVFGTQVYTTWDTYQVFGIPPVVGTEWEFSADYLSERGPAGGTKFTYDRWDFLGVPGKNRGVLDAWFIQDDGLDNLGRDRRELVPEEEFRGRAFFQHRHRLPHDLTLSLEAGWISDRNFLEQYFEREWDEWKDQSTAIELRQILGNSSWTIGARYRVNDFFTET
ncbi:MAG: hypothetical protein WD176_07225, partial [Pirellulales bacterium]